MAYNLSEVKEITGSLGIFSVTVNNHGDNVVVMPVGVYLKGHTFSFVSTVTVEARSSAKVELIKPLVCDSLDDYIGFGSELPTNSQVEVYLGFGGIWGTVQSHSYQAKYIPKTKFVEVPDTTFDVGLTMEKKPIPVDFEFSSGYSSLL